MIYSVFYSDLAFDDLKKLFEVIKYNYSSPLTAERYLKGIFDTINSLKINPHVYIKQKGLFYKQFGFNVRRVNYKKVAIIYTIHEDIVHIHRIVSSVNITNL